MGLYFIVAVTIIVVLVSHVVWWLDARSVDTSDSRH